MKTVIFFFALVIFWRNVGYTQRLPSPTPQWRPVYHFTPPKNWTNDPNGLIYLKGEYLLYYQHNPFENKWGHMSWGHARSKDLLHWKHFPVAIPERIDKDTTWIFSGSAVWDRNNTSGFCKNGGCLVAVYTGNQPNLKKESQFISYSNDGGLSFDEYDKNPVIDLQKKDFRDPNVMWDEKAGHWRMVVALPAEHKVQFYRSVNLRDWQLMSEFGGDQGYVKANWECPSLFQLPVDGDMKNQKWVLLVSAAGQEKGVFMQYFIGDFDGKTFTNNNPADSFLTYDYGKTYYAAIPYNDVPDGKQIILGWLVPSKTETFPWRGQMSIARDLSLRTTEEGVRLFQEPSSVLDKAREALPENKKQIKDNIQLDNREMDLSTSTTFNSNALWIEATFTPESAKTFGFKLARNRSANGDITGETVVSYDVAANELTITGVPGNSTPATTHKLSLKPVKGKLKLELLFDKSSLEIFANDGEKVLTTLLFPSKEATGFSLFSTGGKTQVGKLKVYDMAP